MARNTMISAARRALFGGGICVALIASATAGAWTYDKGTTNSESTTANAATIANTIKRELAALPTTATEADMEATIVFALSQGDYSFDVMDAALNMITDPNSTTELKQAVANVRIAMLNKKKFGTAAINGGGGNGGGFSSFSSPIVGIGGGSSNYTPS
jgi:hypothetical protein